MKQIELIDLCIFNPKKDPNNLIGERFLCKHGTLLFVGSSGIGKSTFCLQMLGKFALGKPFLGLRPERALKIMYVQAENDLGDLAEIFQGLCKSLKIKPTSKDFSKLQRNLVIYNEDTRNGKSFIEGIEAAVKVHKPDIILIDPLLSYIGGDINQQEVVGKFLRDGLNQMLKKHNAAAILIHHTKKEARGGNDAALGNSELVNHARAVVTLMPSKSRNDCDLIMEATKRGARLGLKDATGDRSQKMEIRYGKTDHLSFELVETISIAKAKTESKKGGSRSEMDQRHLRIKSYIDPSISRKDAVLEIENREGVSKKTAQRDYDAIFK